MRLRFNGFLLLVLCTNSAEAQERADMSLPPSNAVQAQPDETVQTRPRSAARTEADLLKRVKSFDEDGDGFLVEADLPAHLISHFKLSDANSDGKLNAKETAALVARFWKDRPVGSRRAAGTGTPRPGKTSDIQTAPSAADVQQILEFALTFDADKDGGLDAKELKQYAIALAARRSQNNGGRRRGGRRGNSTPDDGAPQGLGAPGSVPDADPFGRPPNPRPGKPPTDSLPKQPQ